MGLLDRVAALAHRGEERMTVDQYISDVIQSPWANSWLRHGVPGIRASEVANSLPGYTAALKQCPPAFAAQMVRALVVSQARFVFRNTRASSSPRKTFGTRALGILESPWPRARTGEMVARMEWHAGLTGNAYTTRRGDRLRVLRPDWVGVAYGSDSEPDDAIHALDGEVIGYVYCNGGFGSGNEMQTILPGDMAHWSPLPDPESPGLGMSWLTPAIRDMQTDRSASTYTDMFFRNGASTNLVVKGIPAANRDDFNYAVDLMESRHAGPANAFKTIYLTAGADASVIGADLRNLDLKTVRGAGETRIAFLSRVPAPLLGIAEGLAGSSLNAGNFGMARRMFADTWVYPTLQDLAAALSPLVDVPSDAELWTDTGDMPLLREDGKDAAEIQQTQAVTLRQYIETGFDPDSAVKALLAGDISLLAHTGLTSVQLQKPGGPEPALPEKPKG